MEMEPGASLLCSGAPARPLAVGLRLVRKRGRLADERVDLDVRPQGLGSVATEAELEEDHLLGIDREVM